MVLSTVLVLALLAPQETDVAPLIEQLGDTDPTVREAAEAQLRKIGTPAFEALRKASAGGDPERAARARGVAEEIDFQLRGRIACMRGELYSYEAALLDPDRGTSERLFCLKDFHDVWGGQRLHLQWVPGRRTLLVFSEHWSNRSDWIWYHGWTVPLPHGKTVPVAEPKEGITSVSAFRASSPDGSFVVYASGESFLNVVSLNDSKCRRLKIPQGSPFHPAWSPDGKKLVFELWNNGPETCVLSVDREEAELAVRENLEFPVFTAQGDSILGLSPGAEPGLHTLVRLDLSTRKAAPLAKGLTGDPPALSPDGKRVAGVRLKTEEIVLVDLDGKNEATLAKGTGPTWSPDGSRIAYERGGRICVLDLKTRHERDLGEGKHPSWSR